MKIEKRIEEMGLTLPDVPAPLAAYVPGQKGGRFIFTAGQLPIQGGELKYKGKLGQDYSVEEGHEAAKIAFLNCLGVIKKIVGDLDKVKQVVKINGFVNSVPDFTDQPKVLNGASELCVELFGKKGEHARAAVGSISLPMGAAVEVEMIVEIQE